MMNLRIYDTQTGKCPNKKTLLIRYISKACLVSNLITYISDAVALERNGQKQAWHERASHTVTIKDTTKKDRKILAYLIIF